MELGRTTPVVLEEPRVLEAEAAGGVIGRDIGEHGAPAPPLPLARQNMQEAEVVTPPRREVNGHGGGGASGLLGLGCLRGGHKPLPKFPQKLTIGMLVGTVGTSHGALRTF